MYDNYKTREDSLTREIKNITKRHNNLKDTIKQTKDRNLQLSYIEQSKEQVKNCKIHIVGGAHFKFIADNNLIKN